MFLIKYYFRQIKKHKMQFSDNMLYDCHANYYVDHMSNEQPDDM